MENKAPLSPHIQIYKWHISSLVSISHRITGIINIIGITFVCLLASLIVLGESNYEIINSFLSSSIGKFVILGLTWQVFDSIRSSYTPTQVILVTIFAYLGVRLTYFVYFKNK